jgi:hypothetical protein
MTLKQYTEDWQDWYSKPLWWMADSIWSALRRDIGPGERILLAIIGEKDDELKQCQADRDRFDSWRQRLEAEMLNGQAFDKRRGVCPRHVAPHCPNCSLCRAIGLKTRAHAESSKLNCKDTP